MSTTTIFILGIFLTSTLVLFGMHYFVEISTYLEQSPKFSKLTSSVGYIQQSIFHYNATTSALRGAGSDQANNNQGSNAKDTDPEGTYGYEPIDFSTKAAEEEGDHYGDDVNEADDKQIKNTRSKPHHLDTPIEEELEPEEAYGEEADDVTTQDIPVQKPDTIAKPVVVHHKKPHNADNTASSITSEQALINNRLAGLKVQPPVVTSSGKVKKPTDPYNYIVNIDPDWGMEGKWELPYIKVLPTKKPPLKKDRVVVFNDIHIPESGFNNNIYAPSSVPGQPRALTEANIILQKHILHNNKLFDKHTHDLEDVMYYLKNSPECLHSPIYLTMATVHDDLYWQLIENFVYTLVKFEVVQCSLVICVSDLKCMKMCDEAYFPCYNYVARENPKPSVMEQIAQVQ